MEVARNIREGFCSANRQNRAEYLLNAMDLKFREMENLMSDDPDFHKPAERITSPIVSAI